jgi:glycosyltransferase involved in cell wall biosynthesis
MTRISVIVPTYNRLDSLRRLVGGVERQSLATTEFEFVVVDDGSSDDTLEYISALPQRSRVRVVPLSQRNAGPAAARNLGVREARGDLLIFTDDDCVPEPNWLETMARFFTMNRDVSGFGGSIQRMRDTPISKWIDQRGIMQHPVDGAGECVYLVTANAAYTRDAFDRAGGFSEDISWPGGEDPELSHRVRALGGRLLYCKDGVVKHEHRDTYGGLYKMFYNHGRGSIFVSDESVAKRVFRHHDLSCWRSHVRTALRSAQTSHSAVGERFLALSCDLVQAVGFCRGRAVQLGRLRRVDSRPVRPTGVQ